MNRGVNRGYREGTLRPDGSLAVWASAGAPVVYRGDRLPADLAGNVFVTEPAGNLVRRFVLTTDQAGDVRAHNAYERAEFLASTDERFRPVNLYSAPDGTLYVVDMYRGVIQHAAYQTEYLKDQIKARDLVNPIHYGRIYRIVHVSTRREARPALSRRTPAELVEVLRHPNGWWRDTAQRLLVERGDRSVAGALRDLVARGPDERTRLHAFWTLDGLDELAESDVTRALADRSEHLRAAGARASERWLAARHAAIEAAVLARLDDPSLAVRRQAAASLGALPSGPREDAIAAAIERHGDDPVIVDAGASGLAGSEMRVLERLLAPAQPPRPDAVSTLVATLLRARQGATLLALLQKIAEPGRAAWQRAALLGGFEARSAGPAEGVFGPPRSTTIEVPSRPDAFLALARNPEPALGDAVTRVAARLDWPGRPKPKSTVPALTPVQQERFVAGQQIYASMCVACHQTDGRGQNGLAPPLVGSKWVLGRAGHAARIVLHGKEGTALMPPLAMLSDEEVAAVLTYVRRAWGQSATAVEPSLVREARGASTGRKRPWTDEELAKVTQPDGLPPPR
jgi:mono/diheme cytochrome c family protein